MALFRFSYYKWMPYVESSTIISGIILLFIGVLLLIVPLPDMEIFLPIKKIIITNIMITSLILFIISVGLSIGKKYLKRYQRKIRQCARFANNTMRYPNSFFSSIQET